LFGRNNQHIFRVREKRAPLLVAWVLIVTYYSRLKPFSSQSTLGNPMIQLRTLLIGTAIAATLALTACSSTPMVNTASISAKLSSANEVPANTSTGTGMLDASFNKDTSILTWTVSYSGMTGPVSAGHFHGPAMAGANAGVALGFTGSMDSPIKGSATLTAAQAADLLAGKWYVNLHTAANKGGEIRGQATVAN
jgi:hypothetical protein